jgi:hypothetical protein
MGSLADDDEVMACAVATYLSAMRAARSYNEEHLQRQPFRHALSVHLRGVSPRQMHALDGQLDRAIRGAGVGEYDGFEASLDGSAEAVLFAYGTDAGTLWAAMRPVIARAGVPPACWRVHIEAAARRILIREKLRWTMRH